jgi:DNA-binding PadR family transcriptional regulator
MRDFHHEHHEARRRGGPWRGGNPFGSNPFGGGFPFGPGNPGRGGHPHGRGRERGRRGNVRAAILALLNERPMHGYEMIKELDSRTGGVWRPSPGSVYPTLQLLEDEGLITSEESGGRKRFTLTEAGRAEAETAAGAAPWTEFSEDAVNSGQDTREAVWGIMNALRQIGFSGDREQWQRAVEVLNETKRKLYAILAEQD